MQQNRKRRSRYSTEPENKRDPNKPKILKKCYHVTSQTAYHIQELAFQEQTTEGRIIDKLIRTYLCERSSRYQNR